MRAHYTGGRRGESDLWEYGDRGVGGDCAIASERASGTNFPCMTQKRGKLFHISRGRRRARLEHLGNARQSKVSDTAYKGRVFPLPAHFPCDNFILKPFRVVYHKVGCLGRIMQSQRRVAPF